MCRMPLPYISIHAKGNTKPYSWNFLPEGGLFTQTRAWVWQASNPLTEQLPPLFPVNRTTTKVMGHFLNAGGDVLDQLLSDGSSPTCPDTLQHGTLVGAGTHSQSGPDPAESFWTSSPFAQMRGTRLERGISSWVILFGLRAPTPKWYQWF